MLPDKPRTLTLPDVSEVNLSEAELSLIASYRERQKLKVKGAKIKLEHGQNNRCEVIMQGNDQIIPYLDTLAAFGTDSGDFVQNSLTQILDASCGAGGKQPNETEANGILAALRGIKPEDETEAMLAAQMVATHSAAMRMMAGVNKTDNLTVQESSGNLAVKLMKTFTAQMEALNRNRGKGQQKMTVEHVHVHAGGQAIVGNVQQGGKGG